MKYGYVFPRANIFEAIESAKIAEETGWDGFFVWEPTYGIDAWVTLAAIAVETDKIRLGTLLSPPSRMRPWKLASEVISLDVLSKGRITLSVGLGAIDTGFAELGENIDLKTRAELLDESLDILEGLWSANMSNYDGNHYKIKNLFESDFFNRHPPPELVQKPRIPIWVVGAWPYKKSMTRALKYDGIIPIIKNKQGVFEEITPEHIHDIKEYIKKNRDANNHYDIIIEGKTPGDNFEAIIEPYVNAGVTWWIESDWITKDISNLHKRVEQGPPKIP